MLNRNALVRTSRIVVRTAFLLNRFLFVAFVLGLLLSWVFAGPFAAWVGEAVHGADLPSALAGMRWLIVLGIAMSLLTDRIFVNLSQVITSVSAGDPFVIANARRLQDMGWWLLGLQLLDIPGALLGRLYPSLGTTAPSDTFSIAGWLSVLMVFVLSQVFAAGSAMRDEIAGTG